MEELQYIFLQNELQDTVLESIDTSLSKIENNEFGYDEENIKEFIRNHKKYDSEEYKEKLKKKAIKFLKNLKKKAYTEKYRNEYFDKPDKCMKFSTGLYNLLCQDLTWINEESFHKIYDYKYKHPKKFI